jgi:membrane-associated phospholipid phosphatase
MSWLRASSRPAAYVRRTGDLALAALAVALLVPMGIAVDGNQVSDIERSVFRAINGLPDLLYGPLWPFMQLGNLLVIPVAALGAAFLRWFRPAAAILVLGAVKLFVEDIVKDLVFRERPGSVIADVALRGDTPSGGQAFVSGHAIIAVGIVTLLHPYLTRRWRIVAWTLAFLVCFGRVYSGAHFPLDVIGGGLLGFALGSLLGFILGVPSDPRRSLRVKR